MAAARKKASPARKNEQEQVEKQQVHAEEHPEEFPALDGSPEAEVAKRSQDQTETEAEAFRKDYVVLKRDWDERTTVDKDATHLANIEAARQFLMSQGLRPTGDGSFVGEEDYGDGASVILHYDVPATPAVTATEETVAHAHVTLDDQHAQEKSDK